MVDWSKYGLEDFAETFRDMGIETEGDLIDMAPMLEDMGLHGLCAALGIPRPKKKEPAPTPAPKKSVPRKKSGFEKFLNVSLGILFALIFLLCYLSMRS